MIAGAERLTAMILRRWGEVWYAEAPSPDGPWTKAVKVIRIRATRITIRSIMAFSMPMAGARSTRGTYTLVSGNPYAPSRYRFPDELMYRLDLEDERLKAASGRWCLRSRRHRHHVRTFMEIQISHEAEVLVLLGTRPEVIKLASVRWTATTVQRISSAWFAQRGSTRRCSRRRWRALV